MDLGFDLHPEVAAVTNRMRELADPDVPRWAPLVLDASARHTVARRSREV
jgi:hypothetical protein